MKSFFKITTLILGTALLISCKNQQENRANSVSLIPGKNQEVAVFSEGCFWCTEYVFESVKGIDSVVSGFSGGEKPNPTYEEVGKNDTGYAESVLVYYKPYEINFRELLNVFFLSHNPTTLNKQGPDEGSSYRSIAYYKNENEKKAIKEAMDFFNQKEFYNGQIVTEIKPLKSFYLAGKKHQNYVKNNPTDNYVIEESLPRFQRFLDSYKGELKK
ncbi:MAG: peptide-methionine (S)-S-oxide reductase [Bacteroidetes bacterium HGW-Bacteroidetes-3]|jgi:peptide-methionine (S)-S-oxide reductase|nr:MAG: peptide-methionine (S)-S-oxide reductase [Bacteroidetes bacterium HGW-Bacteroidetes-3]